MSQSTVTVTLPSDANATVRSFGLEELELLKKVMDSGVLNCTKGTMVRYFERRFAKWVGSPTCRTTTSGTAAIHAAVAAIDPEPGDEFITSPITDMGAITPILYQTAIPVFADVDPLTYNVTAKTIEKKITRRTRAVVVTHLFGNPCDMDSILDLCQRRKLPVIEDCAQAFGARYGGRHVGTLGAIGCFSLQQGKHMTTGEGGMVVTADEALARRMRLFIDKAWGYGDPSPDHYFLAPNYRMTELQGAVALAQLERAREIVDARNRLGTRLTRLLSEVPGVTPQAVPEGSKHSYFLYLFRLDLEALGCTAREFSTALAAEGVPNEAHQITGGRPVYLYDIFQNRSAFPGTHYPFHRTYSRGDCPIAEEAFDRWITMNLYEHYRDVDIEEIAFGIGKVAYHFAERTVPA